MGIPDARAGGKEDHAATYRVIPHSSLTFSSSLYVGYVEDGESVDAIMKKFAELDRMQNGNSPLDDQQLRELFVRTSAFTIESAQMVTSGAAFDYDDETIFQYLGCEEDEPVEESGGETALSEEDEDTLDIVTAKKLVKQPRVKSIKPVKAPKEPKPIKSRIKKPISPDSIIVLKLPDPITRSWALLIDRKIQDVVRVQKSLDIRKESITLGTDWLAVLMDPPFSDSFTPLDEFANLQLPEKMTCGFLFIWSETEYLADLVEVASRWGFTYVENAAWIRKSIDNRLNIRKGPIFGVSHSLLLIFRKVISCKSWLTSRLMIVKPSDIRGIQTACLIL